MGSKRKRQAQDVPVAAPAAKKPHRPTASKPNKRAPPSAPLVPTPFIEDPKGPELKREVLLYEQLGSEDPAERLQAADAVVSGLLGDGGVSETILRRHLERRLFRGLASGRKGSRLGFSVVLTEILGQLYGLQKLSQTQYTGLSFGTVLDILRAKTKPEGDTSGQEERDHALGLLFGLESFVRAKILFEDGEDRWENVFELLTQLAKKKSWVREECGWVIVQALGQMNQSQAEETLAKLHEAGLAASSEGVGIWLTAREKFPEMNFPNKPWGNSGNPLDHLKALARALKESSSTEGNDHSEQTQQKGNWNPQLHYVWNIVMHQYVEGAKNGKEGILDEFGNFWKVAVDENLFSSSASPERKFWGFSLFQKMVKDAAPYPEILNIFFSHNLIRCLINHVSQDDRFLHLAAEKSLKVVQRTIETDPSTAVIILPRLISGSGVYNFDQVTKMKTVDKILSKIEGDIAISVIGSLLSPIKIIKTADSVRDAYARRQMFGDYMLSMIRRINIIDESKDTGWVKLSALPILASLAYSDDTSFEPPLTEKSRNIFKNRLSSALAHLITDPNGFSYPCDLLQVLKPSAVDMDENIVTAREHALMIVEKVTKKAKKANEDEKKPLQALALLYSLVIFQLYNGEADAIALLDDLSLCYDKLVQGKDGTGSDSQASVLLLEILLSLISKSSMLLRKVALDVFATFSGEINAEGLKILLDVLESSESIKGQQELFDQENAEDDLDEEEDELDSDVEILDGNGASGNDDSDDDEIEDEDEDDEANTLNGQGEEADDDGEDDEEAEKLDEALAKALGTHRANQDLKEVESDSDADMSDSEMLALDTKLVEIFSQRKKQPNKKQEKKDARENIVNFKSRILDLLEIFVKQQAASPLVFEILVPILKLMRTTTAKHLSEKGHNIITTLAKASKGLKVGDAETKANVTERLQIMKDIHAEAGQHLSRAFAKAASTASLLVATSLYRAGKSNAKKIVNVYRDTQIAWLEGEVKIQAAFFTEWINWCQSHANAS